MTSALRRRAEGLHPRAAPLGMSRTLQRHPRPGGAGPTGTHIPWATRSPVSARAHLYHDALWPEVERESLTGHGVLYVRSDQCSHIAERPRSAARYQHEISFKRLRGGAQGALFDVAQRWVNIALDEFGPNMASKQRSPTMRRGGSTAILG